jgi:hypothetical protein
MSFAPFYLYFPELIGKEALSVSVTNSDKDSIGLPAGNYLLYELYCDDPDCDCRRVIFIVLAEWFPSPIANIGYGWESQAFYRNWLFGMMPDIADQLCGIQIESTQRQTKYAPAAKKLIENFIRNKPKTIEIIKRHYRMMREKFGEKKTVTRQIIKTTGKQLKQSKAERLRRQKKQQLSQEIPKLSAILEEMADIILPASLVKYEETSALVHTLCRIAWNNSITNVYSESQIKDQIEKLQKKQPNIWHGFISNDYKYLITLLTEFKHRNHADDKRIIVGMDIIPAQRKDEEPRLRVISVTPNEYEMFLKLPEWKKNLMVRQALRKPN